jgi:hypothetical protein
MLEEGEGPALDSEPGNELEQNPKPEPVTELEPEPLITARVMSPGSDSVPCSVTGSGSSSVTGNGSVMGFRARVLVPVSFWAPSPSPDLYLLLINIYCMVKCAIWNLLSPF